MLRATRVVPAQSSLQYVACIKNHTKRCDSKPRHCLPAKHASPPYTSQLDKANFPQAASLDAAIVTPNHNKCQAQQGLYCCQEYTCAQGSAWALLRYLMRCIFIVGRLHLYVLFINPSPQYLVPCVAYKLQIKQVHLTMSRLHYVGYYETVTLEFGSVGLSK